MSEERKQLARRWYWLGAFVVLIAVYFSVRSLTRERQPVRAVRVTRAELVNTVSTNGRVEPEVNYEVHTPVSAVIKESYVQAGDKVQAGKLLMVLDDMEAKAKVAAAESGLKGAQAALETAQRNGSVQERQHDITDEARAKIELAAARKSLDAVTRLNATGAASQGEVAAARQRYELADADMRAASGSAHSRYSKADIAHAQSAVTEAEANLALARQILAQTVVHAPASGTVYSVSYGRTELADPSRSSLKLADLSKERIRAYFDEPEIGKLAVGQKIQIKWDAKPSRVWNGHILRVPVTVITFGTRNVGEVMIQVDDPDGALLPDTNVTVTVTTSSEPNSLAVPREALLAENSKYFVYKVVNDALVRTPVTIGTINLTQVAILSGLQEGDLVVTGATNGQPLTEGVAIKVVR